MGGKRDDKNGEHPFPNVWGYKGASDITEGDITERRVCIKKCHSHPIDVRKAATNEDPPS